jgi:uncharacterized protein YndB with AHSA1/START domain
MTDHIAAAEISIDTAPVRVWEALTDPTQIRQYMFGAEVRTSWQVGSPITWSGDTGGRPYHAKGVVLDFEPPQRMVVSHFSPSPGKADVEKNYQVIQYDLDGDASHTTVRLHQTGNDTEQASQESSKNWQMMLEGLKKVAEASDGSAD